MVSLNNDPLSSRDSEFLKSLRFYKRYFRNEQRRLLRILIVSIAMPLLVFPIAFCVQRAFDQFIPSGDLGSIILTGVVITLLYLLNSSAALWNRYWLLECTKGIIKKVRIDVLHKLYSLPRSFYSSIEQSRLHTIAVQDTERLDVATNALFANIFPCICVTVVLSGVLIYLNALLFLIVIMAFLVAGVIGRTLGRKTRMKARSYHGAFQSFSSGILFVLQMIDLTRLQSAEEQEIARQTVRLEDLRRSSARLAWMSALFRISQDSVFAVFGLAVLVAGGVSVATNQMTLGSLIAFYAVLALLKQQMQSLYTALPQIIEGHEALIRLFGFMSLEAMEPYSGQTTIEFRGRILLEHVQFQYGSTPVLRDINMRLVPGRSHALVGPNGSGKTTIANLILGFYRPQRGCVYVDDQPLERIHLSHLRGQIGVVPQSPLLFSGTIRENIAYGFPLAEADRVERAARLATAHHFISQFPDGYDTLVGDHGVLLSGGQRQRVVIARAMLRKPSLLILDEPTIHLDQESVGQIIQNLQNLENAPAILIISHDEELVSLAEDVYSLRDGIVTYEDRSFKISSAPYLEGEVQ